MSDLQTAQAAAATVVVPAGHVLMDFSFRAETLRDEKGNVVGKGKKPAAFQAALPVPSIEELIAFLTANGTEARLIVDAVENIVYEAAKTQINSWREQNNTADTISPAAVDLAKLDFSVIANTPREATGRQGVSEEQWAAFYLAYHEVMTKAGDSAQAAANQVLVITNKFKTVKDVKVLDRMSQKLDFFVASADEDTMREHLRAFMLTKQRLDAAIAKASETSLDDIG